MQEHLLTFEQEWTDAARGRTLPKFLTEELHAFMSCGILGRGFAHLFCKTVASIMLWRSAARLARCAPVASAGG